MRQIYLALASTLSLALSACGNGPEVKETRGLGLGGAPGELTTESCETDAQCDDGAFCNGRETCDDGFCRLGVAPSCDDGIECTRDVCSHSENTCVFSPPDEDGDGFADASCKGPSGEALGQDCDDDDSDRFPGNPERCTANDFEHDEDCDPQTFGHLDVDGDGAISAACCNKTKSGQDNCGEDCDDDDYRRYPEHPEICDDIDNDCDDKVDVNTREVLWYPDEDGDHFGSPSDDAILSCAPIDGHSLRDSDCDDQTGAVNAAAVEVCDGADNDCDGEVDEGGVCACAPEGNARACACGNAATGVQSCIGGLWAACDCTECVTGTVDCLGELLPRECVDGRWVVQASCRGTRPICLGGECTCADGTQNCAEIPDIIAPSILGTAPESGSAALDGAELEFLAVAFSEAVKLPENGALSVYVTDAFGNVMNGELKVGGATISFTPSSPLLGGSNYTLNIETSITDLAGNALRDPRKVHFSTLVDTETLALSMDSDIAYDSPQLDVSPGGQTLLLAKETSGYDLGLPDAKGMVAFQFNGANWERGDLVWNDTQSAGVIIDDRGIGAAALEGITSRVHYYNSEQWSAAPLSMDGFTTLIGLHTTSLGYAYSAAYDGEVLRVDYRTPADSTTSNLPFSPLLFNSPANFQSALGEDGHGLISYTQAGALHNIRSGADLVPGSWTAPNQIVGADEGAIKFQRAAMAKDGTGHIVYIQARNTGFGLSDQLLLVNVGATGELSGGVETPQGIQDFASSDPHIDVDGTGNITLVYQFNSKLYAVRRLGENWATPTPITSPLLSGGISEVQLDVAENGDVAVTWLQLEGIGKHLWGAKYREGQGWTARKLVDSGDFQIDAAKMAVDGQGVAHVAYVLEGLHTFRF